MSPPHGPAPLAPGLVRRMASFVYEGLLLFGVLMLSGWMYVSMTQQRHALQGRTGLQGVVFAVLGLYFVWFWSHGGQTLAQKTWRLRVTAADGRPPGAPRAALRYLLSWLWFLPSLAAIHLAGLSSATAIGSTVLAGILAYAASSRLLPGRQFLHDVLSGTRIVDVPAVVRR